ncbi:MAG: Hsp20/alpha crystallin family protein [Gemmatimonadetes bacterium]|nr:Hsp20/alpha crystallin family protein [Gemmatimonadota bacterium]
MSRVQVVRTHEPRPALPVFSELSRLMQEVERRAFARFQGRGRRAGSALDDWTAAEHEVLGWPAAEVKEVDGRYELAVTLPGYAAGEVEVAATPRELVVHASTAAREERRTRGGDEGADGHSRVLWSEFGSDDVYRCFAFAAPIDVEQVTARLENGMLRVRAPRAS